MQGQHLTSQLLAPMDMYFAQMPQNLRQHAEDAYHERGRGWDVRCRPLLPDSIFQQHNFARSSFLLSLDEIIDCHGFPPNLQAKIIFCRRRVGVAFYIVNGSPSFFVFMSGVRI